jgi:hypothetical protein
MSEALQAVVKHLVKTGDHPEALKVLSCVQKPEPYEATRIRCLKNGQQVARIMVTAVQNYHRRDALQWYGERNQLRAQIAEARDDLEMAQALAEDARERVERALRRLEELGLQDDHAHGYLQWASAVLDDVP